ncbi:MAG: fibronectin type III domain-containing protein, partial [Erysipelotrichaceae bacterium]|nr:fibronectin type III domain-containing protein [Erysipelotrichaceae bacterium]
LTANKVYFYKVRAYRTVSGKKIYSSFVEPTAGFANPSAPTDLKATVASTTSLKLSWKKSTGASMYSIYRDSGSGYELIGWYLDNGSDGYEVYDWTAPDSMSILGELIDTDDENVYAFTDYNCEFGKEYKYKVKAFGNVYYDEELCGFTESSYSSSVTAKTAMKVVRSTRYYYTLSLVEVSPLYDEDAEEIGYQLQRKTSDGSYKTMYTGPSQYTMHGNPCVIDRTFKPGSTYYYRVRAYVVKDGKVTYTPWSASKKVSYKVLDYEGSGKWPKKIYFENGGYIRVTKASVKAYNVDKDAWLGDFKFTFTYDKRSTPNIRNTGYFILWTLFEGYLGEFTVGKLSSTGTVTVWMRNLPLDVISYTFYDEYVGNYSGNPDDPQFDVPYELDPEMEPLPKE